MTTKHYKIQLVDPAWVFESEEMGTKTKFWYRRSRTRSAWLFKYPRPSTGEHWAEKIASGVARLDGIPCASVMLSIYDGERGSAARSFVKKGEELFHGNQILAGQLDLYAQDQKFNHKDHTLRNIF